MFTFASINLDYRNTQLMKKGNKMPLTIKNKMIKKQINLFKYKRKPFLQLKKNGDVVAFWNSLGEIRRLLGYKPYYVQRVLHGEFKTFKGYIWKYV